MKKLLFAILLSCLTVFTPALARPPVPLVNVENADLAGATGRTYTLAEVEAAVRRAAAAKAWTIQSVSPGVMIGALTVHGKHTIKVDITFNERVISLKYRDSINMNYAVKQAESVNTRYGLGSPGQGPVIHPFYMDWVDRLLQTIRRELSQA